MKVCRSFVVHRNQNAAVGRVSHGSTWLDNESVEREMVRWSAAYVTGQDLVQIRSPLVDRLSRPALDEVETDILKSRAPRRGNRTHHIRGLVQPAEHPQTSL